MEKVKKQLIDIFMNGEEESTELLFSLNGLFNDYEAMAEEHGEDYSFGKELNEFKKELHKALKIRMDEMIGAERKVKELLSQEDARESTSQNEKIKYLDIDEDIREYTFSETADEYLEDIAKDKNRDIKEIIDISSLIAGAHVKTGIKVDNFYAVEFYTESEDFKGLYLVLQDENDVDISRCIRIA